MDGGRDGREEGALRDLEREGGGGGGGFGESGEPGESGESGGLPTVTTPEATPRVLWGSVPVLDVVEEGCCCGT